MKHNPKQKLLLDELGSQISKDNFKNSLKKLNELCFFSPFQTQLFCQLFINAWSAKINQLLSDNLFDAASLRIKSLYFLVKKNVAFNKLLQIYFNKTKNYETSNKQDDYEESIFLSMKSQYFYQQKKYAEAESCAEDCFKKLQNHFKKQKPSNDSWFIVRKCLANIRNKKKAKLILEKTLFVIGF